MSFIISIVMVSTSHGYSLSWNANTEEDLAGYKIYQKTSSVNYCLIRDVGNTTKCKLSELYLYEDTDYYLVVTAYDTSGNESKPSSEDLFFVADDYIPDGDDNCPDIYNPFQEDNYPPGGNSIGDACDCEGDFNCSQSVGIEDANLFLDDFLHRTVHYNPCTNEYPCNGDFNCDGSVDVIDLVILLGDLNKRNIYNKPCPPCGGDPWCTYP